MLTALSLQRTRRTAMLSACHRTLMHVLCRYARTACISHAASFSLTDEPVCQGPVRQTSEVDMPHTTQQTREHVRLPGRADARCDEADHLQPEHTAT